MNNKELDKIIQNTHKNLMDVEASANIIADNNIDQLTEEQSRILFGQDYSSEREQQRHEAYVTWIKDLEDQKQAQGKQKLLKKWMDLNLRERFLCARYQHTEHNNPKGDVYLSELKHMNRI